MPPWWRNQVEIVPAPQANTDPLVSNHGLFVILCATALALLATPLAAPAMPEIAKVFADNAATEPFALWLLERLPGDVSVKFLVKFVLLSIPAAGIILSAPLVGWLCDNWSRKYLLTVSLILFGISGTAGYFATSFLQFFIGRAILGVSIAGIKTATVAMVADYYSGEQRNKVIGWQGSAMKAGGVLFMLLGGLLANYGWQAPFLGYLLAFALLPSSLIALVNLMPEPRKAQSAADAADARIAVLPCVLVFISATLASTFFFIAPVQIPFFLKFAFDVVPFKMGLAIAVGNTVGALVAMYFYLLKGRLHFANIYALIFLSMALGYLVVSVAPSYNVALLGMVVAGVGFGLYAPNQSAWILSVVPPQRRGFGVALVTTAMFLGQFIAPLMVLPLSSAEDPRAIWRNACFVLLALAAVYVLLTAATARRRAVA